ncbi:DNA-binding protein YbiB, partial [Salmonella enterica subsp. enterica serovar Poona]
APHRRARWTPRGRARHAPAPEALHTHTACWLVATREAATLEDGLARVEQAFSE